jgi:MFS superfamily sulfate permease-like transporter
MEIIPWIAIVSGLMSLAVWGLSLEKYCTLIPNSVLEGFSMGVGITIGCGQLNFALGLDNKTPSKVFYENVFWSFSNIGDLQLEVFLPFFIFFVTLFSLMKFLPGRPWIILIAVVGNLYGILVNKAIPAIRPLLLQDKYPEMDKFGADIVNFGYMSAPWAEDSKITCSAVIFGALKVAFVAVLETLISARIADTKTG